MTGSAVPSSPPLSPPSSTLARSPTVNPGENKKDEDSPYAPDTLVGRSLSLFPRSSLWI
ncbi:similar to An02g10580 [Aspergillus luchuensis]|uniref:Similar to An02g10580 n=1 Tax=Aspergillus kawachii TaxID=1069201 RepID=A0A146FEY9_ASPKA|nr:similar to An02g10580 [Aspergillus luchuensis]